MKRLALIITCFIMLCLQGVSFANDNYSFIYINGSNNNNEKMKKWYINGVKKLHPVLRNKFMTASNIKKMYPVFGAFNIQEEPVIYFWGNKSKEDLEFLKIQVDITKALSAYGGYLARTLITEYLHDAIWVQKSHNMANVLDDLNVYVKNEADKGNNVVLFGYSAGGFVAYEYMLNRINYINIYDFMKTSGATQSMLAYVKSNPKKNTCIAALTHDDSSIGTLSSTGHIVLNQNEDKLRERYLLLDEYTDMYCAPEGKVKGIVNFASPLVLFYSDLADRDYEISYYNRLLTKYIFENGLFLLTVNFKEDPLGFPTSRNLTVQETSLKISMPIKNPTGVIYDNSSVWGKKSFINAHTSYWSATKAFPKGVVNTFIEGYRFQYDPAYQKKMLKKRKRMFKKNINIMS